MRISPSELKITVKLEYPTENTARPTTPVKRRTTSARVLMAEDNQVNQKLSKLLFKKLNVDVDIVSDGEEAVDAVINGNYQLVLMDIQMPLMDGLEATALIKQQMDEKRPVIIALTANAMQGDRERFIAAGMDDYLPKPISLEELKRIVDQYVTA